MLVWVWVWVWVRGVEGGGGAEGAVKGSRGKQQERKTTEECGKPVREKAIEERNSKKVKGEGQEERCKMRQRWKECSVDARLQKRARQAAR
jgi:hypothetical protein